MSLRVFERVRNEAPALVIPLAVALSFGTLILGWEILWGDFVSWYYPSHYYAAERLSTGDVPLWNPYSDSGMPFMGEADHGTLYPPSLLLHAVGPRKLALFHALQAFTLLHIVWGGLSLYLFARSLGCSPWASAIGGLAFGLSGTFMARASHVSLICAQAWLPAALGGLHHAVRAGGRRGLAVAAVAAGMIALSGSPATAVVMIVGLVVIAVASAAVAASDEPLVPRLARALGLFAIAAAIGVLLGAAQLLPMMELVDLSERSVYAYSDVAQYAMRPEALVLLLLPRFYGWLRYDRLSYWGPENFAELSAYGGILTLVLAAAAVRVLGWRRAAPWLALAGTGLWLALGAHGGLHYLFYRLVPVLGEMRAPGRFLLLWSAGLAVLAALGADALLERARTDERDSRRFVGGAAIAVAVIAAGVFVAWPAGLHLLADWQDPVYSAGCRRQLLALALSLAALAVLRRHPRHAAPVLAGVLAFDLVAQWQGVGLHDAAEIAQVVGPTPGHLASSVQDPGLHRVASPSSNPGEMMMAHVQSDSGPGRHLRRYHAYRRLMTSRGSALFDLLNVKYVVEPATAAAVSPGPNLVTAAEIWLGDGMDLPVEPPTLTEAVDVILTASADDLPGGTPIGELRLSGPKGEHVQPIRLGVETGSAGGGEAPLAAEPIPVEHHVHVADAGTLRRVYYRWLMPLKTPALVSNVHLRHAGGATAVIVKELRLVAAPGGAETWRRRDTHGRPDYRVHENLDTAPRAWMARSFLAAGSYDDALGLMRDRGLDLRRDVVLELPPAPMRQGTGSAAEPRATVTAYAPESISVRAEAPAPGAWLVLSEVVYPGWTATVDGEPSEIVPANGLFRAVWVPGGGHDVAFRYRPASFYEGATVSGITAAGLVAWAAWLRRGWWNRRRPAARA